jgi:hypothetical protein
MKKLVAFAALAVSLSVCLCSHAQENLPASASVRSTKVAVVAANEASLTPVVQPATPAATEALPSAPRQEAMLRPNAPVGVAAAPHIEMREPKLIDKKFMALGFLAFATTSLDMELTQHCLQRQECVELNPTLPTAHWAMYATNTPVNAGVMWLAYKRRKGGHRDWWVWPALDAGIHLYGVSTNARYAWGGH